MSNQPPHIILIPGAFHTADAYSLLVPLLEAQDYPVTALTLPSVGADPPITSSEPEIEYIRGIITPLLDQGRDVVVVMHSFAGVVGSSSLRGFSRQERQAEELPGAVTALVYLCAIITLPNQSGKPSGGGAGAKDGATKFKVDGDYIWHLDPIPAFYNDLPEDLAKDCASKLRHHSFPALKTSLTYAAYQHIPSTYLLCKNDNTLPYERQLKMIEEAGCPITSVVCDAGHSPFLSQPEFTAQVINNAIRETSVQ